MLMISLVMKLFCADVSGLEASAQEEAYRQCVLPAQGASDLGRAWNARADDLVAAPVVEEMLLAFRSGPRGEVPAAEGLSLDFRRPASGGLPLNAVGY